MFGYVVVTTLGVLLAFQLTQLPGWSMLIVILGGLLGMICYLPGRLRWMRRAGLAMLMFVLGVAWVKIYSQIAWQPPLAKQYFEKPQRVIVHVTSMPHCHDHVCQFQVTTKNLDDYKRRFRVYWYGPQGFIKPGQRWCLTLKLKPIHDAGNPGEVHFERWGLYKGIDGFGYVKAHHHSVHQLAIQHNLTTLLELARYQLLLRLKRQADIKSSPAMRLLPALTLGDRHLMTPEMWRVLQKTGTSHLVAISGLHVGLIATWLFLLGLGVWRLLPSIIKPPLTAQQTAALVSCLGAGLYSLLADLPLSTQRAFLMLIIAMSGYFLKRYLTGWQVLACVLVIVLILEPTAVLAISFWLSFAAVTWIIYLLMGRQTRRAWGVNIIYLQIVLCLGLIPVTLFFFHKASLIAPLVNLIAIPWIGFIIVPLSLLGLWISFVSTTIAHGLLMLASWNLELFWWGLSHLAQMHGVMWQFYLNGLGLIALMLACFILLAPKGWPSKSLSIWLVVPVLWHGYEAADNRNFAQVLAIKKGTAVVVHGGNKRNLLYLGGISQGHLSKVIDEAVIPALLKQHIYHLQWLIVNQNVMQSVFVQQLHRIAEQNNFQDKSCAQQILWQTNQQKLAIVGPKHLGDYKGCLVSWRYKSHSLLIAGHIKQHQEHQFIEQSDGPVKHTILIAPMGGSHQASSWAFIKHIQPQYVIVAAGYMNPYHWPSEQTLKRYTLLGAKVLQTQHLGAIKVNMDSSSLRIEHYSSKPAWWQLSNARQANS